MSGTVSPLETRVTTSASTPVELSGIDATPFKIGELAFVASLNAYFTLYPDDVVTPIDNINTISTRSGVGRWIKSIALPLLEPTYAYISNFTDQTIAANSDVSFGGASVVSRITAGPGSLTIQKAGDYNFDFQVRGTPNNGDIDVSTPLVFEIRKNGSPFLGRKYASEAQTLSTQPRGTELCVGTGIVTLAAGDVITLHNRTSDGTLAVLLFQSVSQETCVNALLRLNRIA